MSYFDGMAGQLHTSITRCSRPCPTDLQALADRDVAFEAIMEHPERELVALAHTLGLEAKVPPCTATQPSLLTPITGA